MVRIVWILVLMCSGIGFLPFGKCFPVEEEAIDDEPGLPEVRPENGGEKTRKKCMNKSLESDLGRNLLRIHSAQI